MVRHQHRLRERCWRIPPDLLSWMVAELLDARHPPHAFMGHPHRSTDRGYRVPLFAPSLQPLFCPRRLIHSGRHGCRRPQTLRLQHPHRLCRNPRHHRHIRGGSWPALRPTLLRRFSLRRKCLRAHPQPDLLDLHPVSFPCPLHKLEAVALEERHFTRSMYPLGGLDQLKPYMDMVDTHRCG